MKQREMLNYNCKPRVQMSKHIRKNARRSLYILMSSIIIRRCRSCTCRWNYAIQNWNGVDQYIQQLEKEVCMQFLEM